jgi:hypothetical protein
MSARQVVGTALLVLAAVGCGGAGSGPAGSGGRKGVESSSFALTVRGETAVLDPATHTTIILPGGGLITSNSGGIDCGIVGGTLHKVCSAKFPYGTTGIVLTATPDTASGYRYYGFAGACGLGTCSVDITSDRFVVVRFAKTQTGLGSHPNMTDGAVHAAAYRDWVAGVPGALQCTACHGTNLEGQGLAVGCGGCHASPAGATTAALLGGDGGTLTLSDGTQLSVSPGILPAPTTLSIGLATVSPPLPPGVQPAGPMYSFGPSGIVFPEPVLVTLPIPPGTVNPTVYWTTPDGTTFEDIGGTVVGNTIQVLVTHFCPATVATYTPPRALTVQASIDLVPPASYSLHLSAQGLSPNGVAMTSVVVTGPAIPATPFASACAFAGRCLETWVSFGTTKPTPGSTYRFDVAFADSTSQTYYATVNDLGVGLPMALGPAKGSTIYNATPTFSWSAAAGQVSRYTVSVFDSSGKELWYSGSLSPLTTSITYDFNNSAPTNALPPGTYQWALIAFDSSPAPVTPRSNRALASGNTFTVAPLVSSTGRATVTTRIRAYQGPGYYLDLIAKGGGIASVTVSGPTVGSSALVPAGCDFANSDCFSLLGPLTATKPNVGDVYQFTVNYLDSTSEVLAAVVHDLTVGYPTLIAPAIGATVTDPTPTFSWTAPSTGCVSRYGVIVEDSTHAQVWSATVSGSTTSVAYNADGSASVPSLASGTYTWSLIANDDCAHLYPSPSNWTTTSGNTFTVATTTAIHANVAAKIQAYQSGAYFIDVVARGGGIATATVSGPAFPAPRALTLGCPFSSLDCFWATSPQLAMSPTPGDLYTFNITYTSGLSETLTAVVNAPTTGYATLLAPVGVTLNVGTPTFSWKSSGGCVSRYVVDVRDSAGAALWSITLDGSAGSVVYNTNGAAHLPALPDGDYQWAVSSRDCAGTWQFGHNRKFGSYAPFSVAGSGVNTYSVGGTVSGLLGSGLVLRNNGGDDLSMPANGVFAFPTKLTAGAAYSVTVTQQPMDPEQTCAVSSGAGFVGGSDVASVVVTCSSATYPVAGSVSGLRGTELWLDISYDGVGVEAHRVAQDGAFAFVVPGPVGSVYSVGVGAQPSNPSQTCSVLNGTGILNGPVSDVGVECTTNQYVIGGAIYGLGGGPLVLSLNGQATGAILVTGDTGVSLGSLPSGATYSVAVASQPPLQTCTVTNGSGVVTAADVTTLQVTCSCNTGYVSVGGACVPSTHRLGGTISGILGSGLVLASPGEPNLNVLAESTSFQFATALTSGSPYDVTVAQQPVGQVCLVGGGAGMVGSSDVTISVTCLPGTFGVVGSTIAPHRVLGGWGPSHLATALPDGRVLVAGGLDSAANPSNAAEEYDPVAQRFTATAGTMVSARAKAAATVLPDGKVLVTGGLTQRAGETYYASATAELYDPATRTFQAIGSMAALHYQHTSTLLSNGLVLIAGGGVTTAELYDPATRSFTTTGSMSTFHWGCTATRLPDGRVLIAGGNTAGSPELYDPVTGTFTPSSPMVTPRLGHTAILMPNGLVLIAGGVLPSSGAAISSAETFDPTTGWFTPLGSMNLARSQFSATLLPDGRILLAGGDSAGSSGAEVYDPWVNTFTVTGSMSAYRFGHVATRMPDGTVLVTGGGGLAPDTAEVYIPAGYSFRSGTFLASSGLVAARYYHTDTVLPNGSVLVTGGYAGQALRSAEVFDYFGGRGFVSVGSMSIGRYAHSATALSNGRVLIAGGFNGATHLSSAEIYDPATGSFSPTGAMASARGGHTATLLANGLVLIVGGNDDAVSLAGAELYNPATGTFMPTGSMAVARSNATATTLPDGRVLVSGGSGSAGNALAPAEVYDPAAGRFTSVGSLAVARSCHRAVLLPSGDVLIVGGTNSTGSLSSAELYHSSSGTFSATGVMHAARQFPSLVLLPNGLVLAAGGAGALALASAELYDARAGTFSPTGAMTVARYLPSATLVPNGWVLFTGGQGAAYQTLSQAEIFLP